MVDDFAAADGHGDSGADAPAVKRRGAAQGAERTAVDHMGAVQIQHSKVRVRALVQRAARRLRPRLEAVAWRSFSASFVSLTPLLNMAER